MDKGAECPESEKRREKLIRVQELYQGSRGGGENLIKKASYSRKERDGRQKKSLKCDEAWKAGTKRQNIKFLKEWKFITGKKNKIQTNKN